jgi:hypothetical protein
MEKVIIDGGKKLEGTITVSGMKNAAVAVLYATVLAGDVCVIENLQNISDVAISLDILKSVGATVEYIGETEVKIDTTHVLDKMPPDELAKKMRASYYLIGATLGRFGHSIIGYPGGCDFGVRPIDQHIKAFNALGADVNTEGNVIEATAREGRLKGNNIFFDCVTVGGTMNAMLAAVLAEGVTEIENAAREPHIVALANFLNFCGAEVSGAGTDKIKIKGVEKLHKANYSIIPDVDTCSFSGEIKTLRGIADECEIKLSYKGNSVKTIRLALDGNYTRYTIDMKEYPLVQKNCFWWPHNPNLFDFEFTLYANGKKVDCAYSRAGLKKISIDENGRICLNNKPIYQRLILDQGYWEESGITPPSVEAIRKDIQLCKDMGFNGARGQT